MHMHSHANTHTHTHTQVQVQAAHTPVFWPVSPGEVLAVYIVSLAVANQDLSWVTSDEKPEDAGWVGMAT